MLLGFAFGELFGWCLKVNVYPNRMSLEPVSKPHREAFLQFCQKVLSEAKCQNLQLFEGDSPKLKF